MSMWFYTFVHEVTHSLVFSPNLYNTYIVQDSNCPTSQLPLGWCTYEQAGLGSPTVTVSDVRGGEVIYMRTPNVRDWAREHYACETMVGMELENQGGSGTYLSHWETRLTHNELMTGAIKLRPSISGLTLALFDDSGWYKANQNFAETFLWGKNSGCAFVNEKCVDPDTSTVVAGGEAEFCTGSDIPNGVNPCSHDHRALSYCASGQYNGNLPDEFQYFDDPTVGGTIQLYDYCPVITEYSNGLCSDPSNKQVGAFRYGQIYETGSICVPSSVVTDRSGLRPPSQMTGRCYQRECSVDVNNNPELRIYFTDTSDETRLSQYAVCPFEGGVIDPSTSVEALAPSQILCPPYQEVCIGECTNQCSDNGNCVESSTEPGVYECVCFSQYTGDFCQTNVCPGACSGNGECNIGTGMCECADGFYGIDCSQIECTNTDVHPGCGENGECRENSVEIDGQLRSVCDCIQGFTGDDCSTLDCPGDPDCSGFGSCVQGQYPAQCGCENSGVDFCLHDGQNTCTSCSNYTENGQSLSSCTNDQALSSNGIDSCIEFCFGKPNVFCDCDDGRTGESCNELLPGTPDSTEQSFLDSCYNDCGTDGRCADAVASIQVPTCFCNDQWGAGCEDSDPGMIVHVNVTLHGRIADFTEAHQARWREALGNFLVVNPLRVGLLGVSALTSSTTVGDVQVSHFQVRAITYPPDPGRLEDPNDPFRQVQANLGADNELNLEYTSLLNANGLQCPYTVSQPSVSVDCVVAGTVASNSVEEPRLSTPPVPEDKEYNVCLPGVDLCNYKLAAVAFVCICFLSVVYGVRYSYYATNSFEDEDSSTGSYTGAVPDPGARVPTRFSVDSQRIDQV